MYKLNVMLVPVPVKVRNDREGLKLYVLAPQWAGIECDVAIKSAIDTFWVTAVVDTEFVIAMIVLLVRVVLRQSLRIVRLNSK